MTCRPLLIGGGDVPNSDGDIDARERPRAGSDRGVDNEVGAGKNGERKEGSCMPLW